MTVLATAFSGNLGFGMNVSMDGEYTQDNPLYTNANILNETFSEEELGALKANIPEDAKKPERSNKKKEQPITLLDILREEKANKYSGGIYHKTQIELTYNSNHIEGSRLTHDQTRYIFETNTIGVGNEILNVDDVIETANHFRCIDFDRF